MLCNVLGSDHEPLPNKAPVKRWFKWLVVGILAAVIILVDILTGWIQFPPALSYGNTPGNLANMGLVAEKDGWIYYYCSTFKDSGLYKVRINGTEKTKLNDDFAFYINVSGDWVYYVVTTITDTEAEVSNTGNVFTEAKTDTKSESAIYKTQINGSGESIKIKAGAENIIVADDWIYYTSEDNKSISKIRTDGTVETLITDDQTDDICLMDGWIYYTNASDGNSLYRIRTDGKEKTLLDKTPTFCVIAENGWVYYSADNDGGYSIFKTRADGTQKTDINIKPFILFNIKDGWIYFCNTEDESYLYKARTDGTGKTKLSENTALPINIVGDWIYYTLNAYRMKLDGTENQPVE